MAILKIATYLGNCCSKSENKLYFDPRGRNGVYVQLLEFWQMAKLVLKQSVKAHGPLVQNWAITQKWLILVQNGQNAMGNPNARLAGIAR